MKIFNKLGCLICSLALISIIMCSAYVYYGIIIKIRDFPEDGDVSLSGCYVTKGYIIDFDESMLLNFIYKDPGFIKVFDAKTKKCIYTSDIYDFIYLSPLTKGQDFNMHGFFIVNTSCQGKFVRPREFTPDG